MNSLQWMFVDSVKAALVEKRSGLGAIENWVVSTTLIAYLGLIFRFLLLQTLLYSLPKALLPLASPLSTSLSILASDEMVQPR